jgi:hypothetical protein
VESAVLTARALFRDIEAVRDHNSKIRFHELQADLINTRIVSFYAAVFTCIVFVIRGAVVSGAGPAQTLGKLGAVNALAGAYGLAAVASAGRRFGCDAESSRAPSPRP